MPEDVGPSGVVVRDGELYRKLTELFRILQEHHICMNDKQQYGVGLLLSKAYVDYALQLEGRSSDVRSLDCECLLAHYHNSETADSPATVVLTPCQHECGPPVVGSPLCFQRLMASAALTTYGWSCLPAIALCGGLDLEFSEGLEEAEKHGVPVVELPTDKSSPFQQTSEDSVFAKYKYPEHKTYVLKGFGFLVLGQDVVDATHVITHVVIPNLQSGHSMLRSFSAGLHGAIKKFSSFLSRSPSDVSEPPSDSKKTSRRTSLDSHGCTTGDVHGTVPVINAPSPASGVSIGSPPVNSPVATRRSADVHRPPTFQVGMQPW